MSSADIVPPIAAGVGADLRAAREAAGWSLPQLATHLRIRLPYLEALEGGRIGLLPGNAYAVAFMRSYAQALGLDPEEIVRRFRCEAAEVNRRTELEFPAPLPERGIPAGAIVVVGLVIAIGGYAVWWRGGGAPAPAPRVAEVPAHLAVIAGQPVTPPLQAAGTSLPASPTTGPMTQASAGTMTPAAPVASADSPQTLASAPSAPAPAAPRAAAPPVADISPASAAAATAPNPSAGTFATAAPGAAAPDSQPVGPNTVVISATADAWLEVRNPAGQILLNKVLHKGETWPVPDEPGLVLTTGNAGGTSITLGDVSLASLGTDGMVRHNLPLDPAVIRAGGLASSAAPPKQGAPKTN
jgi:cytoskeleton protein RodZ